MTVETIEQFMDSMVRGTLNGICLAFWLLCLVSVWKWFLGVMKRALFCLFPGLKEWADARVKMKEKKKNGNDNDDEPLG